MNGLTHLESISILEKNRPNIADVNVEGKNTGINRNTVFMAVL